MTAYGMLSVKVLRALFLICAVIVGLRSSNASPESADQLIYKGLLLEFANEIKSFDQTTESHEEIKKFEFAWQDYVLNGNELPWKILDGKSWSSYLNPQALLATSSNQELANNLAFLDIHFDLHAPHSIEDLELYSRQRIGEAVIDTLSKFNVNSIVYAGDLKTLARAQKLKAYELKIIPSPYSSWGIHKVFAPSTATPDQIPRFYLVIPPSTDYAIHYGKMFLASHLSLEKVVLNKSDKEAALKRLTIAFESLKKKLGASPDIISLGYFNDLKARTELKNLSQVIPIGEGLYAQLLEDTKSATKTKILILKSDLTIWGESSSQVIKAALKLEPSAVLFMGSAGGITPKTHVYDVSIPKKFILQGRQVPVVNLLSKSRTAKEGKIVYNSVHGHTHSPVEQTKPYVSTAIRNGIDTYDVEQNLIADVIAEHNKTSLKKVGFAALNLITDKPSSLEYEWKSGHDLSVINQTEKSRARATGVAAALLNLNHSKTLRSSIFARQCQSVFRMTAY